MTMRLTRTVLLTAFVALFCCPAVAQDKGATMLPEFTLPVPESSVHQRYLGLAEGSGAEFSVHDIDADVLLIELFSMYCPYCHAAAPAVNELYDLTQEISAPGARVVMIGLGANNTEFEVDQYRQSFVIEFPLFSDKDMSLYRLLEGQGTPGFIGCRKNAEGQFEIVVQRSGAFDSPEEFLEQLLTSGGGS